MLVLLQNSKKLPIWENIKLSRALVCPQWFWGMHTLWQQLFCWSLLISSPGHVASGVHCCCSRFHSAAWSKMNSTLGPGLAKISPNLLSTQDLLQSGKMEEWDEVRYLQLKKDKRRKQAPADGEMLKNIHRGGFGMALSSEKQVRIVQESMFPNLHTGKKKKKKISIKELGPKQMCPPLQTGTARTDSRHTASSTSQHEGMNHSIHTGQLNPAKAPGSCPGTWQWPDTALLPGEVNPGVCNTSKNISN